MKDFIMAVKAVAPIVVTYIFLGMACGIFYSENGLSPKQVLFAAITIYSGSMTFILAPLLVEGASFLLIAFTTLFVNGRHLFYGIACLERYSIHNFFERIYLALTLTDEVYSIEVSPGHGQGVDNHRLFNLYVHMLAHATWIFGSMLGAFAGDIFPFDLTGIEFSGTAFFVIVVIDQFISYDTKIPLIVGFIAGMIFIVLLGGERFILPAMLTSVIVLTILKSRVERSREAEIK